MRGRERGPDGTGHVTAQDTWSRFDYTHSFWARIEQECEMVMTATVLKSFWIQLVWDALRGTLRWTAKMAEYFSCGCRQERTMTGRDGRRDWGRLPRWPPRVGWCARAAWFERLNLHCETSRYRRSVGRWLTKTCSLWAWMTRTLGWPRVLPWVGAAH